MLKKISLLFALFIMFLSFSTAEAGAKYYFSGTTFEDNNIKMVFDMKEKPSKTEYPFKLTNKTNSIIKVVWNQAALIAGDGSSHRVGHGGVSYSEITQGKEMQPTIIAQQSFVNDVVFFADGMQYWGSLGWINMSNLYPGKYSEAVKMVGTSRKLLMPVEINSEIIYYTFEIKVEKVEKD